MISGILSYTYENGPWHVWMMPNRREEFERFLSESRADGIIANVNSPEMARLIQESGLPMVNVSDELIEGLEAPCVRTDDAVSTQLAVDHFIERGFRNLAFIGPTHRDNPVWYAETFKRGVEEENLNYFEYRISSENPLTQQAVIQWLEALPKPAGILAWGHGFARRVLDACLEAGISVPHDVAVLSGNYDELLCHASYPPLSGILLPTPQIGYRSAELLHKMLQGRQVASDVTFMEPVGVMERMSTDTLAVEDKVLEKVVHFLKDHAFEHITMDDVLKAIPMSRRSLERRFFKAFGRTPMDEVRRLRINKARQLLIESDMQMQEIAEACGYATYNYLARVFKEMTGVSPSHYRNEFRIS